MAKKKHRPSKKKKSKSHSSSRDNQIIIFLGIIVMALIFYVYFISYYPGYSQQDSQTQTFSDIKTVLDNPISYKDQDLKFSGFLRKLSTLEEYLLEDIQGHSIKIEGKDFGTFTLNEKYNIKGKVISNQYCFCTEVANTYYWKPLGEMPQEECENMTAQCKLGTFFTDTNGTTLCECQIQDILRSSYKDIGKMLTKTCEETQGAECKNTTFEYSTPYLIVTEVILVE